MKALLRKRGIVRGAGVVPSVGVLLLLLVSVAGCPEAMPDAMDDAGSSDDAVSMDDAGAMDDPDAMDDADGPTAARLFTMVTKTDPFQGWAQFPEAIGTVDSAPPHGPMARTWINSDVEAALKVFAGSLPGGSIIVKENLGENASDKEGNWTIMWKVSGFDAENNDWFWANMTPDGNVTAEGNVGVCIGCHGGARDNDFVFQHQF